MNRQFRENEKMKFRWIIKQRITIKMLPSSGMTKLSKIINVKSWEVCEVLISKVTIYKTVSFMLFPGGNIIKSKQD